MNISVDDLSALSAQVGLSSEQPLGHVALCLWLQEQGHPCSLFQYSIVLECGDIRDVVSGMALQWNEDPQGVWEIGGHEGWKEIEEEQVALASVIFEDWCGKPPSHHLFSFREVAPIKWRANCYVKDCLEQLRNLSSVNPPKMSL